jgi:hypothetical protein
MRPISLGLKPAILEEKEKTITIMCYGRSKVVCLSNAGLGR